MPTLDEIIRQIKSLDRTKHLIKRKEIKELPDILHDDEKIEKIATGVYGESLGIIVATDKRFLFINKSMFSSVKAKDYPYDKIDRVELGEKPAYWATLPSCQLYIFSQGKCVAEITTIEQVLGPGIFDFIQGKLMSPELYEIVRQIRNLDGTKNVLKREEIKELPGILRNDEIIEKISKGFYDKNDGIIVATSQRFLFINMSIDSGVKVKEFPYEKIDSVKYKKGIMFGGLHIYSKGKHDEMSLVEKALVRGIFDSIQSKISSSEDR